MKITIEYKPETLWTVSVGDTSCRNLGWDEMLGQVTKLTLGMTPNYTMRTPQEYEEYERRMNELTQRREES